MMLFVTIVSLLLFAALLLYGLKMFQHNSYRPERFLRWLRSNPVPRFFVRSKVGFALTKRVWRLLAVSAVLGIAAILAVPKYLAPVAAALAYGYMLLAWLILAPVEKLITGWYVRDAARRLREQPDLKIVGITGSFGKTSTKNFLYRILSERYNVIMTPGNFNTTLGVVRTIRESLKPYHEVFIVEMGARQTGDIAEICNLVHPHCGIVTAVGEMHLETFGSIENIQSAKFELIRALPDRGFGLVNADSPAAAAAAHRTEPDCTMQTYGIDAHRCDWRAGGVQYSPSGTVFDLIGPGQCIHIVTPLLGRGNVLDLTAACVMALHLGVAPSRVAAACSKIGSVEHRLSISRQGSLTILDDAYNSNPEGAAMALEVLARMELPEGARRVVVTPGFVEMGTRQADACRELGRRAAAAADILVVVNRLNRDAILEGAAAEASGSGCTVLAADTLAQASEMLRPMLRAGDAVLYENDLPESFR